MSPYWQHNKPLKCPDQCGLDVSEMSVNYKSLKVVCAWCEKLLKGLSSAAVVSHGCCADCYLKITGEPYQEEK